MGTEKRAGNAAVPMELANGLGEDMVSQGTLLSKALISDCHKLRRKERDPCTEKKTKGPHLWG